MRQASYTRVTIRRTRPVVLTALAAILAMIPLPRSVFFGPMAITMMGGLAAGTVLTLLFLPALYAFWFRVRRPENIVVPPADIAPAVEIQARQPAGLFALGK